MANLTLGKGSTLSVLTAATAIAAGVVTSLTIGSTTITTDKAAQLSVVAASATESALLDDGNAPEVGHVYRFTGALNSITKAQGDTSAHAAALACVGNSTLGCAPLSLPTTIVMDGACTPGMPVYLSAATAGIGTHTASSLGMVPLFSAKRNVSLLTDASPDYLCEVVPFAPMIGHVDIKSKLDLDTAADLGARPEQLSSWFEDFAQARTVTAMEYRVDGWRELYVTPAGASVATFYNASTPYQAGFRSSADIIEPAADINSVAWRVSARMAVTTTDGTAFVGVHGGAYVIVLGYFSSDSTGYFSFGKGAASLYDGTAMPATIVHTIAKDAAYHVFDLESNGLHYIRYRIDGGEWTAWTADTGNGGGWGFVAFGSHNSSTSWDWCYYARVVTR